MYHVFPARHPTTAGLNRHLRFDCKSVQAVPKPGDEIVKSASLNEREFREEFSQFQEQKMPEKFNENQAINRAQKKTTRQLGETGGYLLLPCDQQRSLGGCS